MLRGLRVLSWAGRSERRGGNRQGSALRSLGGYYRRLVLESLEDRRLLGGTPGQTYNAQAAATYATNWWDTYGGTTWNSARYKYYSGEDCANFVSQCLIAGGLDLEQGSVSSRDSDGAITGALIWTTTSRIILGLSLPTRRRLCRAHRARQLGLGLVTSRFSATVRVPACMR